MTAPPASSPAPKSGRAGRDLSAAIGVGVLLATTVIGSLFWQRILFLVVVVAAMLVGTHEVLRALQVLGRRVPAVPVLAGAVALPVAAYAQGVEAVFVTLVLAVAAVVLWLTVQAALTSGTAPVDLADVTAVVFVLVYVGVLGASATLMSTTGDGPRRVLTFMATVVFSDIGGYAAGVLSGGRHKMVPTISPGKSWEGFAGSLVVCMIVGAALTTLLLHAGVGYGVLFGAVMAATATLGDLGESLIKRDIGIKDMGTLLPGHGGLMDRLDSVLISAPVAWLLLRTMVPTS